MTHVRVARLAGQLREQVSDIIRNHLSDPRLSWVSVVRVDVSSDLHHAKIYVSVLGNEDARETGLRTLHGATRAVRAELARRLRMKRIPEIAFVADRSIEYSLRVSAILRELGFSGEETEPSDDSQQEAE